MTEHTPGPWHAEFYSCDDDPKDDGWYICHPRTVCNATVVCKVDGQGLDNAANAALIARAPKLLAENEALKKRITELVDKLEATKNELPPLWARIAELEDKNHDLQREVEDLTAQVSLLTWG